MAVHGMGTVKTKLRVGVALSAGGASAMAQAGALIELMAAGIPVHAVAGTSAGAMVGAAYAAGRLPEFSAMMGALTRRRVLSLFDPTWPRIGLVEGRRAMNLIAPYVGTDFASLRYPFAAVATELGTGDEIVLRSGSVVDAVRASVAIPGVFTPQRLGGRLLVDGGLVNPLPVSVARALGANFVIAISVLPIRGARAPRIRRNVTKPWFVHLLAGAGARRAAARAAVRRKQAARTREEALGLVEVLLDATRIVARRIAAARLKDEPPDFLLEIPLPRLGIFDFHLSADTIEAGRVAARAVAGDLARQIDRGSPALYRRWRRWRSARGLRAT